MKRLIKSFLKKFVGILKVFVNKTEIPSYQDALDTLMQYRPDPGTSPICTHQISEPEYDLTIIIPVYNSENYLEECLQSVLSQKTKYQYNIIAINDGSSDGSKTVLDGFLNEKKLTVIHQANQGVAAARNIALREIKAKYLMFVDSDDVLLENAVEKLLDAAVVKNADIVQGSYVTFEDQSPRITSKTIYQNSDKVPPNGVLAGMPWGKVYKASLFANVCFPERYQYEDTIITSIVTHMAEKIATISDVVCKYRLHSASITANSRGVPSSVDSIWITSCMLRARKTLGMKTDLLFYEHILRQVVINYRRTEKEPEQIKRCVLSFTREMLLQEKRGQDFSVSKVYAKLENAILTGDYATYSLLCKFW